MYHSDSASPHDPFTDHPGEVVEAGRTEESRENRGKYTSAVTVELFLVLK